MIAPLRNGSVPVLNERTTGDMPEEVPALYLLGFINGHHLPEMNVGCFTVIF